MKGMILAAGFGTRFRPITWDLPKPMIPLCNRPLLGWAVRAMVDAGVNEIIVNLHHLPDPIRTYLATVWNGEADFELSMEEEILGTGGALRAVAESLRTESTFVLMNGDTVQIPPFRKMVEMREAFDALSVLLLRTPPAGDVFTDVWLSEGVVNKFGEGGHGESLMFAGAHAISPRLLDLLPDQTFSGLTEDVYIPATRSGDKPYGLVHDDIWFDVGKPSRYMSATEGILTAFDQGKLAPPPGSSVRNGSLSHATSVIEGTIERAVVGERTRVRSGARIDRSIVWNDCEIAPGAHIDRSILAHGVELPSNATVKNATVCLHPDETPPAEEVKSVRYGPFLVGAVDDEQETVFEV